MGTDSACPREYFKGKPVDAICGRADRRQDGERASERVGRQKIKMNELTNEWVPGKREER